MRPVPLRYPITSAPIGCPWFDPPASFPPLYQQTIPVNGTQVVTGPKVNERMNIQAMV